MQHTLVIPALGMKVDRTVESSRPAFSHSELEMSLGCKRLFQTNKPTRLLAHHKGTGCKNNSEYVGITR